MSNANMTTFRFECACGETFTTYAAADACRKCRVYVGHVHAAPIELTGDAAADDAARAAAWEAAEAKVEAYAAAWEAAQAAEREGFRATVAALGLDPDRFMHLA